MAKLTKKQRDALEGVVRSMNIATTMNECLWVGDANHKTLYVNPIFEKLSGFSLEECIGRDCVSFFDEEGKRTIEDHHKLRPKGISSQYEANMVSRNGEVIPLLISGAPTKSGGTIGIFTNLTQLKKLSEKDRLSSQIISNSIEAIVVLDEGKKIKTWNAGAEKMFGFSEKDVLNKKIDIIIPPGQESFSERILHEVDEKSHVHDVQAQRMTKAGELIDVSVTVTRVEGETGELIGYLVFYRDISEQKRTSSELQKRFEAIQDAYKELGLQKRQVDYIHEINDMATAADVALDSLQSLIVSAICMLTKCDGVVMRLYDEKTDALDIAACVGVSRKWWNKGKAPYKGSICEEAINKGRALIFENVALNPKYKGVKLLREHGFSSMIALPLFVGGKVLGVINLYNKDQGRMRFIETDFLESFGKQCSLALYTKMTTTK